MQKLSGNVALVTGTSSSFGLAIAIRLAQEGCALHLADNNETDLDDVLEAIGIDDKNEPEIHPTDISDAINAAALALECEEANILINILSAPPVGGIDDLDHEDWMQAIEETLLSTINITAEIYESLQDMGTGLIFNIGYMDQAVKQSDNICQVTINAALKAFSENLDKEAALHGVRVFFILPSALQDPTDLANDIVNQILGQQAS